MTIDRGLETRGVPKSSEHAPVFPSIGSIDFQRGRQYSEQYGSKLPHVALQVGRPIPKEHSRARNGNRH